ncbi:SGNH/GDSL hydrolase family protein [Streptomyces spinoverrucosus]|uniref:SGNH/GDSL hydrolase family protein n=1 Tax=Streptomyces spinoverrucosus TaxID=284043 RepID=UPI0018C3FC76|nr:SGNH/GDSL hydrolase family protein [Streptomyces spinoverrucosus]MBG0855787.1 SGNH/GDSL hydrolase family protein [Streptomyces spinoverrucosus]
MTSRRRRRTTTALIALATACAVGGGGPFPASAAVPVAGSGWVGAWGAAPQPGDTGIPGMPPAAPLQNETLRMIVQPQTSGATVRIRLSNVFGDRPLTIGRATIARQTSGSAVDAATVRSLTFGGRQRVTVAAGAQIVSDPVQFSLPAGQNVAVDLFLPQSTGVPTGHLEARQTSYVSTAGDHAGKPSLPVGRTTASWFFLSGIDVLDATRQGVVTFGDSLTDGTGSTVDANHRYPDYLAKELAGQSATKTLAVVNSGIGGGRLLHDRIGPRAVDRFDRDVLSKASAKYVLVHVGINDIGVADFLDPRENVTSQQIIAGYQSLIERAHARGIKAYGGTLTPVGGHIYDNPTAQKKRDEVNEWLRSTAGKSGGFDKVVDFDAVIRDPSNPSRILPAYDSGDHIHLNDAGYAAMADAAEDLFL